MVSTKDETTGLTQEQEEVVVALLNEATVQRATAATGVPERTIYNWLHEPVFKKVYLERRRDAFSQAVALTQRYASMAVNVLAKIASDERAPHSARVSASRTIIAIGRSGIELEDLAARVDALENPLKGGSVNLDMMPPRIRRFESQGPQS